jgi:hypothetical protein
MDFCSVMDYEVVNLPYMQHKVMMMMMMMVMVRRRRRRRRRIW